MEGVEDPPYAHSPLPVDKNKLREVVQELKKDEQLIVRKKRPSAHAKYSEPYASSVGCNLRAYFSMALSQASR